MGDEIQNTKTTAEDLAIERAEQQLADPSAANMQFLQSTLVNNEFDGVGASTGFFNASAKQSISSPSHSGGGFSGLSPAYSGAGLLGAVAAADMGGASSAMGIAAQRAQLLQGVQITALLQCCERQHHVFPNPRAHGPHG